MKKISILLSCLALSAIGVMAQTSRQEIKAKVTLSTNNYQDYPVPTKKLTASPRGYEPFYISHYGRHGSRWLIGKGAFDGPYNTLHTADSLGKLTERGKYVLEVVKAMRDEGRSRDGELTPLGAQQHRGIAKRMFERFPEVFAGKTHVDAKSTVVIRCILSMENEMQQLMAMNPQIDITHDASYHDMYYMNDGKSPYDKMVRTKEAMDSLKAFNSRHADFSHLMTVLFNDPEYAKTLNQGTVATQVFNMAKDLTNTELRHKYANFWDVFTDDEIYDIWLQSNAYWYTYKGPCNYNGGAGMYTQLNLLQNIVETADTCLRLDHPGATMRFGHEVNVMPLVCLLNLNGYGNPRTDLERLDDEGWYAYNIFPMACNVQFVFYKPTKKSKANVSGNADADILVKVLLNENEATLPVKTDRAPYYHWKDVRAYLNGLLKHKVI